MTDEELAAFLNVTLDTAKRLRVKFPQKVAAWERMRQVAAELEAWQRGEGPKPAGVLVDFDRRKR